MSYVLGLDLGTSGLKGILLNKEGNIVESVSSSYDLFTPAKGYSEQNPKDWYTAAIDVMKQLIAKVPAMATELEGISFSGQMHSLVLLDESGDVLRNAILWNDVRTTAQCETITDRLGDELISITKNKALEGFTLPKILWVKENEPEVWEKVAQFNLPKDYLAYRLTGNMQMEYSDAAGTLLLDIENKEWSQKILDEFDLDAAMCPSLSNSTDEIGTLSDEVAAEVGIEVKVPVFPGGADNPAAAIGAGIVRPNQGMASIGTSGVFLAYEEAVKNYSGNLHFFNHTIPDNFYSMGVTLSAGNSLTWFKNQFAPEESFEELLKDINKIAPGSNGLLFAPYITGERTPYTDSEIRGTFLGMDITHTRDHFARAVLEGITFSLRDSQELMRTHSGKDFKQIVSVGGGASNNDWLQMQADIFNTPIVTLETEQGPAMGAAMVAAVGTGWFADFESCTEKFVNYKDEIQPNPEAVAKYDEVYDIYREVYPTIKDVSHKLVKL